MSRIRQTRDTGPIVARNCRILLSIFPVSHVEHGTVYSVVESACWSEVSAKQNSLKLSSPTLMTK